MGQEYIPRAARQRVRYPSLWSEAFARKMCYLPSIPKHVRCLMHTSYLASFLTVLLLLSAPTHGRQTSGASASIQSPTSSTPSTADYSKEPYVFEFIETDVRYEPDGKGQRDLNLRVRLQSESAVHEFGLLTYSF